jgi:anti-anti-sigma regulatory factor
MHTVAGCARRSEAALVTIAGELDMVGAPGLRLDLQAVPAGDVVLDVGTLRFLDVAGLSVLLELRGPA